jgi:hypothetical protein
MNDTTQAPPPPREKTAEETTALVERNREMDLTVFDGRIGVFNSGAGFNLAQRMATALSSSSMIPDSYRGNPGDCMIAIDYAARLNVPLLTFMANTDVIYGRPALRGTLYIGVINASGVFSRLKFEWRGSPDTGDGQPSSDYGCRAYAKELESGDLIYGAWVDWTMVAGEKWNVDKPGRDGKPPTKSKWNTMREQMFMYRASSFFGRAHAPDITLGLMIEGEPEDTVIDGSYSVVSDPKPAAKRRGAAAANAKMQAAMDADDAADAAKAQQQTPPPENDDDVVDAEFKDRASADAEPARPDTGNHALNLE